MRTPFSSKYKKELITNKNRQSVEISVKIWYNIKSKLFCDTFEQSKKLFGGMSLRINMRRLIMEVVKIIMAVIAIPFLVVGIGYFAMFLVHCLRQFVYLCPFILAFVIIIDIFQIKLSATVYAVIIIGIIIATILMAIFNDA